MPPWVPEALEFLNSMLTSFYFLRGSVPPSSLFLFIPFPLFLLPSSALQPSFWPLRRLSLVPKIEHQQVSLLLIYLYFKPLLLLNQILQSHLLVLLLLAAQLRLLASWVSQTPSCWHSVPGSRSQHPSSPMKELSPSG